MRSKKTRSEWEALVQKLHETKMSQRAFALEHGVSLSSLRSWMTRHQQSVTQSSFVEVPLKGVYAPLVLRLPSGLSLEIPHSATETVISAVLDWAARK